MNPRRVGSCGIVCGCMVLVWDGGKMTRLGLERGNGYGKLLGP